MDADLFNEAGEIPKASSPARNWVRLVFLAAVGVPLATLGVCYLIMVAMGHSQPYMPFISDLDLFEPEDTIFTVGVAISGAAIMVVLVALFGHKRAAMAAAGLGRAWRILNLAALPVGLLAAGSSLLLGFVPWPENGPLHGFLARNIFYGGVAWCLIHLLVEWRLGREVPLYHEQLKRRALPVAAAFIGLVGFLFFSAKAFAQPEAAFVDLPNLALSPDTYTAGALSSWWDLAALFEWLMILGMIATLATYWTVVSGLSSDPVRFPASLSAKKNGR